MGKKIPMWQCVIVMAVLLFLLYWAIMLDPGASEGHIALILAGGFAAVVAVINKWKWGFIEKGILAAINRTMQANLILSTVGMMLASWMAGGIIPSMMYYGIKIINPSIFLFTACILCAIVSISTGSSWSTAGSMGVALIGIGTALGFPIYLTAGAVVSGAYFGDKMSPLSDTTNLAPAVAGSNVFEHIRHMVFTTGPSLVIALSVYLILGFKYSGDASTDLSQINRILDFITDHFNVSLICLLPPVFVIVAVALKLPALPAMLIGVLLGVPYFAMQDVSILSMPSILNNGYGVAMPENDPMLKELASLLTADGMQGMMWTNSLVCSAMVFGGVIDCTGMMESIARVLMKLGRGTRGGLVTVTIFSCIIINILCSDQYLSIILPGRMYKESFEDARLAPKNLSRCLEDSGTLTSNFIPWNTCGATMHKFLRCPQWGAGGYVPYAVLNWVNPLISIFYGFTGITMTKLSEEEYEKILEARKAEKEAALKAMEA